MLVHLFAQKVTHFCTLFDLLSRGSDEVTADEKRLKERKFDIPVNLHRDISVVNFQTH